MGLAARPGTEQLQPVRLAALAFLLFLALANSRPPSTHWCVSWNSNGLAEKDRVCRLPPVTKMTNFSEHSGVTEDKFEGRLGFCCKGTH